MTDSTSSLLLFGGTFDPPHHGHLIVARSAAEAIGASRVVLMPAAQSPHKQGLAYPASPGDIRLELCKAAVEEDSMFEVSHLELDRPPPSYTYDTATELFQQGFRNMRWLIGADQLMSLPRWHRAAELLQLVQFVVAARPGSAIDFASLPVSFQHLRNHVVSTPELDISSTTIRHRVNAGQSISYLTPPGVIEVIKRRGLYRS